MDRVRDQKGRFVEGPLPYMREQLSSLYWNEGLTLKEVAQRCKASYLAIQYAFKRLCIPKRSRKEVAKMSGVLRTSRAIFKTTCLNCGRSFEGKKSNVRWGREKFCSPDCHYAYSKKRSREIATCQHCGKQFTVARSALRTNRGKFCSTACRYEHNKTGEWRYCLYCRKKFYRPKAQLRNRASLFCSRQCFLRGAVKPNVSERKLAQLLQDYSLPYKFVGDGTVILGTYSPDFLNINGKKKVIELFGDYWHSEKKVRKWHEGELGRIMAYKALGFDCLVVWEHELKNPEVLISKIKAWDKVMS